MPHRPLAVSRADLRRRGFPLLLVAPLIALSLSSCSLVPTPDNIVEGLVEEVAEQSGQDVDLDVDTTGAGASLPEGWPGLPVPEGRIVSAIKVSDSFSISVQVENEDVARATVDELKASGFEVISETDFGELKGAMLSSDEYSIVYGWTVSEEEGVVVSYTVSQATS